jgi:hypothetical protein
MRRFLLLLLAVAFFVPAPVRAEEPLVKKVRKSLDLGIDYLKGQQKDQGGAWNWENSNLTILEPGGSSCLAMLALLTAGVPVDDPVVKRGLPYVRGLGPKHTYVVGIQTMILGEIGDPRDLHQIQTNVDWLISSAVTRGGRLGGGGKLLGWTYSTNMGDRTDNSNTQYALLGLWAGRQAGAQIEPTVWQAITDYYKNTQVKAGVDSHGDETGGWPYSPDGRAEGPGLGGGLPSLTMTAAGLSGLFIAGLDTNDNKQELNEATGVAAKCGFYPDDDAIAKGMRWLAQEPRTPNAPGFRFMNPPHTFYNVYGIERVGRLSGQRFIGDHDWYREGCEFLTGMKNSPLNQKSDGRWVINDQLDNYPVLSTSFALLFLAKGRTPILISKLAWDPPGARPATGTGWNRKHNDARHLVEYASRELFKKMPLAWQVFDPRLADLSTEEKFNEELSTLLQSPILYMNGHDAPILTTAQKRLLRRYVDEGGFILAEACCGKEEFARGFKALMEDKEVFGNESPLMPLDVNHPIWSSHALIPAAVFQGPQVPDEKKIQAIERGCKTVVVFSPQPLAGYWEEDRFAPKVGEAVGEVRAKLAYRLAGNIIAYATGLEPPKPRLDKPKIIDPKEDKAQLGARYLIELAQVKFIPGDWEPAKNALRNLALNARDKYLIDVALAKSVVSMSKPKELWSSKFLYMHGKAKPDIDDNEVQNMRAALDSGATLLSDACCGSDAFDQGFRDFAKKLYPDQKLEPIPVNDVLFSADLNGQAITTVRCRMEKAEGKGADATFKDVQPMLEGIKVDGRWVVIYSRYDIGCALEKNKSSACKGYDPDSAMKLATAALLYALKR